MKSVLGQTASSLSEEFREDLIKLLDLPEDVIKQVPSLAVDINLASTMSDNNSLISKFIEKNKDSDISQLKSAISASVWILRNIDINDKEKDILSDFKALKIVSEINVDVCIRLLNSIIKITKDKYFVKERISFAKSNIVQNLHLIDWEIDIRAVKDKDMENLALPSEYNPNTIGYVIMALVRFKISEKENVRIQLDEDDVNLLYNQIGGMKKQFDLVQSELINANINLL